MRDSSLKLQYLVVFLFIISITILTSSMNKQGKKLQYINEFISNIQNLVYVDKNIDLNLKNMIFYKRYEDIENLIVEFDNNLTIINNIIKKYDIATKQQIEIYKKLQDGFLDKKENIRHYNGKMASIYSTMLDMKNYAEKYQMTPVLSILYSKFLNLNFDSYGEIDAILDHVVSIDKEKLNKNELKFINKINTIMNDLIEANDYKFFILNSQSSKYLQNFLDYNKTQYKALIDSLIKIFVVMIIISLMFIIWNLRLLNKIKVKNRDIRFFKLATDNSFNSVIFTDRNLNITYANKAFEQISGYKLKDIVGKNPTFLKYYEQNEEYYSEIKNAIKNKKIWNKDNFISKKSDNTIIVENIVIMPNLNDKNLDGFVSVKLDKTKEINATQELNLKNQTLQRQIYKDHITNTGSYIALMQKLDNNEEGVIIYIRINNFSNLSYFYKSKVIDDFIISFVNTLKLCINTYNIDCEIFRFQLDEFCIFYRGNNLVKDIAHIKSYFATSKINILNDENSKTNTQKIDLILGVSSNIDSNITRLIQAIWAYEEAKKLDEKIYFYQYNDPMEQLYFKNLDVIKLIQNALRNDKVIVECQPIFNIKTNNKIANKYEILIRILDDEGKVHYPGEFLDVAKQILLYNALTSKVIGLTFNLLDKYPNKQFSINLSSSDMINSNIRKIFIEKLQTCKNPSNLYVEILESESISNYDIINPFIKHIKELGCKLSIDDFGSGYSNYYRILEFDIDILKIDGSIVKRLPYDENSRIVMETIVNFAKKMNYQIVAEFVSDENILKEVKKYDVDYGQGFYLGKPVSPDFILFN